MSTEKMPLAGLKVLDLSRVYAGPYCTMMLGDLGAEVIKIERPGFGDDTRDFMPVKDGESGYFAYMNRNKKSITIDLKNPKGVEIVKELAQWADVMVENFSPGVVDKLGIGYKDIVKVNPEIIYGSISGFGQYGPYKSKPAYDVVTQAMGGFMALTGEKDGKPYKLGPSIVDASAGIHMAFAIMAALYYKSKTGKGQYIDVAMMDTAFSTLENFVVTKTLTGVAPTRNGNANLGSAPFNCFKTSDGYVTIACANDSLFKKLTDVMNRPDLLEVPEYGSNSLRKQNEEPLNAEIEEWTLQYKTEELVEMLDKAKIPVGPILDIDDLVEDPHLKSRGMLINIPHPVFGDIIYPGNPLKFSLTSEMRKDSAALLGEHTDEILEKVLYKNKEEIEELHKQEVL
ncbi:MAG: CaiB/BaiF CoA transferase family protein [Anaerovoracaceae bacterium]|jgi:CoA:oxalate CoA-transferase